MLSLRARKVVWVAAATALLSGCKTRSREITSLTATEARTLAQNSGPLYLPHLAVLPADAAEALANYQGESLSLPAVTTITIEAANALAKVKGSLLLDGLTSLSADVARALSRRSGSLSLGGLPILDPGVARALSYTKGELLLNGVTSLSADAAAALSRYEGVRLSLGGLHEIPPAVAARLAATKGNLDLRGAFPPSGDALRILSNKQNVVFDPPQATQAPSPTQQTPGTQIPADAFSGQWRFRLVPDNPAKGDVIVWIDSDASPKTMIRQFPDGDLFEFLWEIESQNLIKRQLRFRWWDKKDDDLIKQGKRKKESATMTFSSDWRTATYESLINQFGVWTAVNDLYVRTGDTRRP